MSENKEMDLNSENMETNNNNLEEYQSLDYDPESFSPQESFGTYESTNRSPTPVEFNDNSGFFSSSNLRHDWFNSNENVNKGQTQNRYNLRSKSKKQAGYNFNQNNNFDQTMQQYYEADGYNGYNFQQSSSSQNTQIVPMDHNSLTPYDSQHNFLGNRYNFASNYGTEQNTSANNKKRSADSVYSKFIKRGKFGRNISAASSSAAASNRYNAPLNEYAEAEMDGVMEMSPDQKRALAESQHQGNRSVYGSILDDHNPIYGMLSIGLRMSHFVYGPSELDTDEWLAYQYHHFADRIRNFWNMIMYFCKDDKIVARINEARKNHYYGVTNPQSLDQTAINEIGNLRECHPIEVPITVSKVPNTGFKKGAKISAGTYGDLLCDYLANLRADDRLFPKQDDAPFPGDFRPAIQEASMIILAFLEHFYLFHYGQLCQLGALLHFNSMFANISFLTDSIFDLNKLYAHPKPPLVQISIQLLNWERLHVPKGNVPS